MKVIREGFSKSKVFTNSMPTTNRPTTNLAELDNIENIFSVMGKVVIVTGALRGNGRAIAQGFLDYGAIVYFCDSMPDLNFKESSKAHFIRCDIRFESNIEKLINIIMENNNEIDILVNNAGVSISSSEDSYDEYTWDKTFDINLKGTFRLSRVVAKIMKNRRAGSIINITSLGAEFGFPNNPAYVASKGGLKQLSKAMAVDLAPYGIRVNNVCPGYIKTDMTKKSFDDVVLKEERDRRIMLNRWGESSDLIGACIFLGSEASSYITGIDLFVDGGWSAKGL